MDDATSDAVVAAVFPPAHLEVRPSVCGWIGFVWRGRRHGIHPSYPTRTPTTPQKAMRRLQGQYLDIKRRLSDGDGAAIDPVTIRMESTPEGFCGVCGVARCVWVVEAPLSRSCFVCGVCVVIPLSLLFRLW